MSRMLPAWISLVLTSLSAWLGSGLPDGWLCTTMMAFALARRAPLMFGSGGCLLSRPGSTQPAVID